jgi:hypothetical protein
MSKLLVLRRNLFQETESLEEATGNSHVRQGVECPSGQRAASPEGATGPGDRAGPSDLVEFNRALGPRPHGRGYFLMALRALTGGEWSIRVHQQN